MIVNVYADIENIINNSFVNDATGRALDLIGASHGLERIGDEDDDAFRTRIINRPLETAANNAAAIQTALMAIDGVRAVEFKDFVLGPGSFIARIIPTKSTDPAILEAAKARIEALVAEGIKFEVSFPRFITIDVTIKLLGSSEETAIATEAIRNQITNNISQYINDLSIGEPIRATKIIAKGLPEQESIKGLEVVQLSVDGVPQLLRDVFPAEDQKPITGIIRIV